MSSFRVVAVISMLVAATLGAPVYEEHQHIEEHYEPAHYEFHYAVNDEHTHDIKEQHEKREGDKVEGYYSLIEPDGTKRTVHYTSDKGVGFIAHVEKSGEAVHAPAPAPAPAKKLLFAPAKKVLFSPAIPVVKSVALPVVKKIAYPSFHAGFAVPTHTYSTSEHQYSAPAAEEQHGSSHQGEGSTSYSTISFGSAEQHYSGHQ